MAKLPSLNGREVLRVLLKSGFYVHHQSGSHARLFHSRRPELRVTIPIHNKDLPELTLKSVLKQADIKPEEFLRLLKD
ncbi:MAG: type II toxin-antitoxin system HicA family toxin [Chloroflexota bacterium]